MQPSSFPSQCFTTDSTHVRFAIKRQASIAYHVLYGHHHDRVIVSNVADEACKNRHGLIVGLDLSRCEFIVHLDTSFCTASFDRGDRIEVSPRCMVPEPFIRNHNNSHNDTSAEFDAIVVSGPSSANLTHVVLPLMKKRIDFYVRTVPDWASITYSMTSTVHQIFKCNDALRDSVTNDRTESLKSDFRCFGDSATVVNSSGTAPDNERNEAFEKYLNSDRTKLLVELPFRSRSGTLQTASDQLNELGSTKWCTVRFTDEEFINSFGKKSLSIINDDVLSLTPGRCISDAIVNLYCKWYVTSNVKFKLLPVKFRMI